MEWLGKVLGEGEKVGLDPFCHAHSQIEEFKNSLKVNFLSLMKIEFEYIIYR